VADVDMVAIWALTATSGNVTVQVAKTAAGGSSQNYASGSTAPCDGITRYWTWAAGAWTLHTAASTVATFTCATGGLAVAELNTAGFAAGFTYVGAYHASANLLIMPHRLVVGRKASNLRSLIV